MATNHPAFRPVLHTERWSLPPAGFARLRTLLSRAARRVCPYCGQVKVFKNWFSIERYCPACVVGLWGIAARQSDKESPWIWPPVLLSACMI